MASVSGTRILAVEDHKPLLEAIRSTLEAEGYTVLTATNGEQALEVLEKTYPDLIVADIMMPKMGGYEFYEAVRARPEYVSTPFIFLTAKAKREDVLKGKALGAEDYLTKPFDPQELLVAVRARLDRASAIREAAELELDELKRQIIELLSHELRTPLTYVTGYTDLALDDISSLSSDELEEFLSRIQRGADRLTRLVNDLLLVIRLDAGRVETEFHNTAQIQSDLAPVLERTVRRYEKPAGARGVQLEMEIAPDLPSLRLCEPLLADALQRLVDNAIKFSRGEKQRVTVTARPVDGRVEIAVSDQGVGIPPQAVPHLFERFRQFDRERLEQQGAGLGLHIAQRIVALHDGEIAVESALGEGSTFTIKLPAAEV